MEKARSRLTQAEQRTEISNDLSTSTDKKSTHLKLPNFFQRYKKYLPTLGLGLICWALFYLLLTRIYPQTVQHWFIPHLYLPVILVFFLAVFFTFAFVLLNTRRGLLISLAATTFLFLRLQQVVIGIEVISAILIFFGILELSFVMINYGLKDFVTSLTTTKRKPRANFKQKTRHRQRN